MKKILTSLLSMALLVTFFASCTDSSVSDSTSASTGEATNTETIVPVVITETIDLSEYSIIVSEYNYYSLLNYINNFKDLILQYTGVDLKIEIDSQTESSPNAKEILIGKTDRDESISALNEITDRSNYLICANEDKVVITAKKDKALVKAMKDFLEDYVLPANGKILNVRSDLRREQSVSDTSTVFENFLEFSTSEPVSVSGNEWSSSVIKYSKILRLSDGRLLATYENYSYKYIINVSDNDGKTWNLLSTVTDTLNTEYIAEWMPHLYELPADMGEFKAGTVLLAGTSKSEKDVFSSSIITIHASTDRGQSWNTICNVDMAGGLGEGVWEPFLIYEEERGRLYCFYSDDSDPNHDQKLVYKYTTDLVTWYGANDEPGVETEPKEAVACENAAYRPGMISIVDMGEGGYLMSYEMMCADVPDVQVHIKRTMDLDDWGDVSDYGKPLKSIDGYSAGSAPWSAYTDAYGDKGILIIQGKHPVPYEVTTSGAKMFVSFDYGETFVAIDNPMPYKLDYKETDCGYSPCMTFSPDGKTLYYVNNPLNTYENGNDVKFVKITLK